MSKLLQERWAQLAGIDKTVRPLITEAATIAQWKSRCPDSLRHQHPNVNATMSTKQKNDAISGSYWKGFLIGAGYITLPNTTRNDVVQSSDTTNSISKGFEGVVAAAFQEAFKNMVHPDSMGHEWVRFAGDANQFAFSIRSKHDRQRQSSGTQSCFGVYSQNGAVYTPQEIWKHEVETMANQIKSSSSMKPPKDMFLYDIIYPSHQNALSDVIIHFKAADTDRKLSRIEREKLRSKRTGRGAGEEIWSIHAKFDDTGERVGTIGEPGYERSDDVILGKAIDAFERMQGISLNLKAQFDGIKAIPTNLHNTSGDIVTLKGSNTSIGEASFTNSRNAILRNIETQLEPIRAFLQGRFRHTSYKASMNSQSPANWNDPHAGAVVTSTFPNLSNYLTGVDQISCEWKDNNQCTNRKWEYIGTGAPGTRGTQKDAAGKKLMAFSMTTATATVIVNLMRDGKRLSKFEIQCVITKGDGPRVRYTPIASGSIATTRKNFLVKAAARAPELFKIAPPDVRYTNLDEEGKKTDASEPIDDIATPHEDFFINQGQNLPPEAKKGVRRQQSVGAPGAYDPDLTDAEQMEKRAESELPSRDEVDLMRNLQHIQGLAGEYDEEETSLAELVKSGKVELDWLQSFFKTKSQRDAFGKMFGNRIQDNFSRKYSLTSRLLSENWDEGELNMAAGDIMMSDENYKTFFNKKMKPSELLAYLQAMGGSTVDTGFGVSNRPPQFSSRRARELSSTRKTQDQRNRERLENLQDLQRPWRALFNFKEFLRMTDFGGMSTLRGFKNIIALNENLDQQSKAWRLLKPFCFYFEGNNAIPELSANQHQGYIAYDKDNTELNEKAEKWWEILLVLEQISEYENDVQKLELERVPDELERENFMDGTDTTDPEIDAEDITGRYQSKMRSKRAKMRSATHRAVDPNVMAQREELNDLYQELSDLTGIAMTEFPGGAPAADGGLTNWTPASTNKEFRASDVYDTKTNPDLSTIAARMSKVRPDADKEFQSRSEEPEFIWQTDAANKEVRRKGYLKDDGVEMQNSGRKRKYSLTSRLLK